MQAQMAADQRAAMLGKAAGEAAPGLRAADDVSPEAQEAVLNLVAGDE
jgi:hypothetical protein